MVRNILCIITVIFLGLPSFGQEQDGSSFHGMSILKVIPFSSLKGKLNFFYSDCLNTLRDPNVKWEQIEVQRYRSLNLLQIKISGQVLEDLGVYIWSNKALVEDNAGKDLPHLQLPIVGHNMVDEDGFFKISVNIPIDSGGLSFPLEFRKGNFRFRYIIQIKIKGSEVVSIAQPVIVHGQFEFCTRNMDLVGWGISGFVQQQVTAPIYGDVQLDGFVFDSLSYEKRYNLQPLLRSRSFFTYNTAKVNTAMGINGEYPSFFMGSDLQYTKASWRREYSSFRVQYGLSGGVTLEQRPFLYLDAEQIGQGGLNQGMTLGLGAGAYAELFSRDSNYYGDIGVTVQPVFLGFNHSYQGLGIVGHVGFMKPYGNANSIGCYMFGHMFTGKQASGNYSSEVTLMQSHIEFRYGWVF